MNLTSMNTVYLGVCTWACSHVWAGRVHLQQHAGVHAHKDEPQVSKGPEAEEVPGSSLQPSLLLQSRPRMQWCCGWGNSAFCIPSYFPTSSAQYPNPDSVKRNASPEVQKHLCSVLNSWLLDSVSSGDSNLPLCQGHVNWTLFTFHNGPQTWSLSHHSKFLSKLAVKTVKPHLVTMHF